MSSNISYILTPDFLANRFLKEIRCGKLLRFLSPAIPFASIHSCVNGYFMGLQKTSFPAFSQLLEQAVRMVSAFLIYSIMMEQTGEVTPLLAVIAMVLAELAASLFSLTLLFLQVFRKESSFRFPAPDRWLSIGKMAAPLSGNRLLISFLQSVEALLIPQRLRLFGYTATQALSQYGILNGMALPMVLFPSAITGAVSMMLVPTVSRANTLHDQREIARTVEATIQGSLLLGIFCTGAFLLFGKDLGLLLFDNEQAGEFIFILGWICPFLYLGTTLSSILNGLGKTVTTFFQNACGLSIRILFVWFCIPRWGITAYLFGLLLSQITVAFLSLHSLRKKVVFLFDPYRLILIPVLCLLSAWALLIIVGFLFFYLEISTESFGILLIRAILFTFCYGLLILVFREK